MIYSVDEKQKLDDILSAFHAYIHAHPCFDIVYSEKIGYVRVNVEDPNDGGVRVIRSADQLLDVLFNEIINDIRFDESGGQHLFPALSADEADKARCRIAEILQTMRPEAAADDCLHFLDEYLVNYPGSDIND